MIRRADKFLKLLLALNKPRPNITFIVTFTQRLTKTKVTQFSILKWLIKYLIYLEQTVFHLVTSTGQESVTLHQAADNNAVTKANCISIFKKICSVLDHVHSKGYLHNDIKGNNVVLERPSASGEFSPVLIDFGKSLKVSSVTLYRRNGTVMKCKGKSYLAPEVVSERLYGVASDIFSLGRMLKAISSLLGFYERVRELVKMSTRDKPSERPSLYAFSRKIADVKF